MVECDWYNLHAHMCMWKFLCELNGLFDDPGYASFNGNQGFFPVLPSFGCKGVAAELWLTLARSLNVR
uniref:Uncharacterized protein n=1 Tax=Tanacetum cinerariifolium TaxID=118510 RepID=A0A699JLA6_TANCI|nr:hypothetical protein [Tanacetum cinerariifolium]